MLIPKYKPTRNRDYLHWIKEQPCMVCDHPVSDAHHLKGIKNQGGMGQKPSDLLTIPLCRIHHQEYHDIGWQTWEKQYGKSQFQIASGYRDLALLEGVL